MIELDRHIEILLLNNDCVIVPNLGGFMAHHVDARYDEADGMFIPPIRTLGFNPQLQMNDSLLVQSYIEVYDISYPEALRRIEGEVEELKSHLETEGEYELNDIGVLRLNDEGHLEFQPCEAGILTPTLYGLSSFSMPKLALPVIHKEQTEVTPSEDVHDGHAKLPDESAITIKMSWLRNVVAVAAAFITFLMIGTPISNSNKSVEVKQSAIISIPSASSHRPTPVVADQMAAPAQEEEQLAPVAEVMTAAEPATAVATAAEDSFCIVMASQVTERNANTFIGQLSDKGFAEARILVSGGKKMRRVVYGSYDSEEQAATALRQLRSQSRLFAESWVMEIKH